MIQTLIYKKIIESKNTTLHKRKSELKDKEIEKLKKQISKLLHEKETH